jgi:TolB-like protein
MNLFKYLVVALAIISLTACQRNSVKEEANLFEVSYEVVDSLLKADSEQLKGSTLDIEKPIIIASFVNVNNMGESSPFGRIISEQFATRFSQKGYYVVELKLRKNIFIKEKAGEFLLSREVKDITKNHDAQAIIVGTYAIGESYIYITARIVNPETNRILTSHDYRMTIGNDMAKLLRTRRH